MIGSMSEKPHHQETHRAEGEAKAVAAKEAVLQASLEFTGEFKKDYELVWEWYGQYRSVLRRTPQEDKERFYAKALNLLERQQWEHKFTTEKGSKYFITASGMVLRAKRAEGRPLSRLQPPTHLIGFVPDEFAKDYLNFMDDFRSCNNRLVHTTIERGETQITPDEATTRITFRNLSPQPQEGFRPLDFIPSGNIERVEFNRRHGQVSFLYDFPHHPTTHMGHAITKIES